MKKETPVLDKKRLERLERRRATRSLRYSSYREVQKGEEKAESFKSSAKRLWEYIWEQKVAFIVVVITCGSSSWSLGLKNSTSFATTSVIALLTPSLSSYSS